MVICGICSRRFRTRDALRVHNQATGHSVCQLCTKVLASPQGLKQHNDAIHSWECPQCSAPLPTKQGLAKHQRKSNHCYCGDCDRSFSSSSSLESHLQSSLHSTEFRCCDCDRSFRSAASLEEHLQSKIHALSDVDHECRLCRRRFRDPASLESHIRDKIHQKIQCPKCSRQFHNSVALEQHLKSPTHRSLGNIQCVEKSCSRRFSIPSALIHHLENGTCSSGVNRKKLNQLVLLHDTDHLITQPQHGIDHVLHEVKRRLSTVAHRLDIPSRALTPTYSGCSSSCSLTADNWTPDSRSTSSGDWAVLVSQTPTKRCPFCSPKRSPFATEMALQQHLQFAAHCEPFVFCRAPLRVKGLIKKPQSARSFNTVSGLVQHLESGKCVGGMAALRKAIKYLEKRLETWGLDVGLITSEVKDANC